MPSYVLAFLDAAGRPQAFEGVSCSDDRVAADHARSTGYTRGIEIYRGGQLIECIAEQLGKRASVRSG